jgi:hypothetical protein
MVEREREGGDWKTLYLPAELNPVWFVWNKDVLLWMGILMMLWGLGYPIVNTIMLNYSHKKYSKLLHRAR